VGLAISLRSSGSVGDALGMQTLPADVLQHPAQKSANETYQAVGEGCDLGAQLSGNAQQPRHLRLARLRKLRRRIPRRRRLQAKKVTKPQSQPLVHQWRPSHAAAAQKWTTEERLQVQCFGVACLSWGRFCCGVVGATVNDELQFSHSCRPKWGYTLSEEALRGWATSAAAASAAAPRADRPSESGRADSAASRADASAPACVASCCSSCCTRTSAAARLQTYGLELAPEIQT